MLIAPHVIAKIAVAGLYAGMNPHLPKAIEFLQRPDLKTLQVGRYEIEPGISWAIISESDLHPFEGAKLEAHRKYIDIQAPLSGPESMGLKVLDDRENALPFDEEKDIKFLSAESSLVTLQPGDFAIFFPMRGAHAPCCTLGEVPAKVKKLVIKVLAD